MCRTFYFLTSEIAVPTTYNLVRYSFFYTNMNNKCLKVLFLQRHFIITFITFQVYSEKNLILSDI